MSIDSINASIVRVQKELADVANKINQLLKKENDAVARINQIERSITKSTSVSTLNSKRSEIDRKNKEILGFKSQISQLQSKGLSKNSDLIKLRSELGKEEDREQKKKIEAEKKRRQEEERERVRIADAEKRRQQENERERIRQAESEKKRQRDILDFQKKLNLELSYTASLTDRVNDAIPVAYGGGPDYDIFISHASEDKDDLVRPLADALAALGVRVWYDEFTLRVGDSLRRSIDNGLAKSRYGTVVLSSAFFAKNWTQYELDGMVAREMNGNKMILPIWHRVTKTEVLNFSPSIADKVALNSSLSSIDEIASQLAQVVLE